MMNTRDTNKIYGLIVKIFAVIYAFIGFCLLCACIRWQIVMNDFLLTYGF